ncbi:unnamed protein product [Sphagnum tenellum]
MLLTKFLQHQLQCQLHARLKGGVQKILCLKNETIKGIFEAAVKIANSQLLQSVMIMKLVLRKSAPFATVMHMHPVDKGEALAMEMDMVLHSGSHVTIETQVDMRDSHAQEKMVAQSEEPGLAGVAALALLTGFKKDYMIPQAAEISAAAMTEAPQKYNASEEGSSSSSRKKGRCLQLVKSMISHVADQIAQEQWRESVVLPNCQSISVCWMMGEDDD